jgi:hypothetical protein
VRSEATNKRSLLSALQGAPQTPPRPDQKIDAAVALMMAIGRAMVEDEQAKGLEGFLTSPIFG